MQRPKRKGENTEGRSPARPFCVTRKEVLLASTQPAMQCQSENDYVSTHTPVLDVTFSVRRDCRTSKKAKRKSHAAAIYNIDTLLYHIFHGSNSIERRRKYNEITKWLWLMRQANR